MADTNTEPTVVSPNAAMAKPEGLATENDQVDSAGEQDRIRDSTAGSQPGRGVQPQPAGPQKLDLQPADAQQPFRIKDIQVGKPDGRQVAVTHIYACQSGEYAIYKAEQVMIAFATDPETAKFQRKLILPLSTTRAELNSLILGLDRRELFDQKLAYALQLALDGDTDGARETLTAAKASVLAKRRSGSLPISQVELRGGCGPARAALPGQPVLSVPRVLQQPLARRYGRVGWCCILHRTRDPKKNGRT